MLSVALARLYASFPNLFPPAHHPFFPHQFPSPIQYNLLLFQESDSLSCDYYNGEDLISGGTGKIIMRNTNRRGKQLKELLIEVIQLVKHKHVGCLLHRLSFVHIPFLFFILTPVACDFPPYSHSQSAHWYVTYPRTLDYGSRHRELVYMVCQVVFFFLLRRKSFYSTVLLNSVFALTVVPLVRPQLDSQCHHLDNGATGF